MNLKEQFPEFYTENEDIDVEKFVGYLYRCGFKFFRDERFSSIVNELTATENNDVFLQKYNVSLKQTITESELVHLVEKYSLLKSILDGHYAVQDFHLFKQGVCEIFEELKAERSGKITTYIPGLAHYSLDNWSVSFCSVDGQMLFLGDTDATFTIQSAMKPILYGIVCDLMGYKEVHKYVGKEPSGFGFNKITLGHGTIPHNPLINIGAITIASLCAPELDMYERFNLAFKKYQALTVGARKPISFNNMVFLSEKQSGHRNYAIGHYLVDKGVVKASSTSKLMEILDLYFQMCSIEVDTPSMAIAAANLANGGKNVFSGEQVISEENTQNMLTLMYSCGMYDYSGEWSFEVGLPAKSGVSGLIMVVLPDIGGLAMWSPPLDKFGNSVRGVEFTKRLLTNYSNGYYNSSLHPFGTNQKKMRKTGIGKQLFHPKHIHTQAGQDLSTMSSVATLLNPTSMKCFRRLRRLPRF